MAVDEDWRIDLERWLEPFLAGLSHPARRRMCPLYIAGLIGPGGRKSVQPTAARAGEVGYDQLHHFVAAGVWDSAPLETALLTGGGFWMRDPVKKHRHCRTADFFDGLCDDPEAAADKPHPILMVDSRLRDMPGSR